MGIGIAPYCRLNLMVSTSSAYEPSIVPDTARPLSVVPLNSVVARVYVPSLPDTFTSDTLICGTCIGGLPNDGSVMSTVASSVASTLKVNHTVKPEPVAMFLEQTP